MQRAMTIQLTVRRARSRDVPRHVAIVMDGNGRWATQRFLPRVAGHKQGVDARARDRRSLRRPRHRVPDGVRVLLRELAAARPKKSRA